MEIIKNKLFLGGLSSDYLIQKFGSPIYVYEKEIIINSFRKLRNFFPQSKVDIHYAMKANFNPTILTLLKMENSSIDAVSQGDVEMALKVGFNPDKILFTGNNMNFNELEFCKKNNVPINIGSNELLKQFGKIYPNEEISLRVNPGVGAGHHAHCITGGPDSKFGIYKDQITDSLKIADKYNLEIVGIHSHIGTGIREADAMVEAMDMILDVAKSFHNLDFIDFGGGFDITYKESDKELDVNELSKKMLSKFNKFCLSYGKKITMKIEPGRYIVGSSGTLLTTITNISKTPSKKFVGVDSVFNHFIRPILYGAFHEIINASKISGLTEEVVVVGNICECGDIFSRTKDSVIRSITVCIPGGNQAHLD